MDGVSHDVFSRLVTVESTGSTNEDLTAAIRGIDGLAAADTPWPHMSALRAITQTAGRGRGQRRWVTPPGTATGGAVGSTAGSNIGGEAGNTTGSALTASLVLRPLVPASQLGWLPLLAGLAVRDACQHLTAQRLPQLGTCWEFFTKWPNDVVILPKALHSGSQPAATHWLRQVDALEGWGRSRKIAGLLADVVVSRQVRDHDPHWVPPSREQACAVVMGIGVNVAQGPASLPVEWAASLASAAAMCGADSFPNTLTPELLLEEIGLRLGQIITEWEGSVGLLEADSPLRQRVIQACISIGSQVRALTPAGEVLGVAVDCTPALMVQTAHGELVPVEAGDVFHLRS